METLLLLFFSSNGEYNIDTIIIMYVVFFICIVLYMLKQGRNNYHTCLCCFSLKNVQYIKFELNKINFVLLDLTLEQILTNYKTIKLKGKNKICVCMFVKQIKSI